MNLQPLPSGGVRALLRTFASNDDYGNPPPPLTGKIALLDDDRKAGIYFNNGRIYAAELEAFEPSMALRLLSSGKISAEQFQELRNLENSEVGNYATEHNIVNPNLVEEINRQNLFSIITHLYEWKEAQWGWEDSETTTRFIMTPLDSTLVVTAADERVGQWNALLRNFPKATIPETVIYPGPDWTSKAGEETTPEIASILRYVDGHNTVGEIALLCGFSRFEMGARIARAIADGLVELPQVQADIDDDSDDWGLIGADNALAAAKLAMEEALEAYQEAKEVFERLSGQTR